MKELTNEEFDVIKQIELEILIETDRICRENNIEYSITYGTLLGAVRHGGFIPWDDDIDIMMVREQYEHFLEIVEDKIDSKYCVMTYKNERNYGLPFAKIMAKNTVMKETGTPTFDKCNGIWIDIFPIDVSPSNQAEKNHQYQMSQIIKSKIFCKCNYSFKKKGLSLMIYRLRKLTLAFSSKDKLINEFENNARKYENMEYQSVVSICGNIGVKKATFDKNWFNGYIDMNFEKRTFRAIKGYKEFLHQTYDNYMELPPEEERKPHHYVEEFEISL